MKQEILYQQLSVLETFAKVHQAGHKCNTEIAKLVNTVTKTLEEVVVEIVENHQEESAEEEYEEEV